MKELAPYLGLGTQMTGLIVVSGGFGYWLDIQFNSPPVLLLVMLILGCIAGVTQFFRTVIRLHQKGNGSAPDS